MNTSTIRVGLIRTLTVVATLNTSAAVVAGDLAIIGEKGQVLLYSPSGGTGTLTSVVESLPHRRPITESYFTASEDKLFASDDTGKLYELDLHAASNGYQRIDTEKDLVSCDVWYDTREKCPAWLHLMDKQSAVHVRFRGKDNIVRKSQNDDIVFRNRSVFGMHIDGDKSTASLVNKNTELAFLTNKYPNVQWIIDGRSKNISVYGRIIADLTKSGEPFKATLLFHNRKQNKWRVESLEEYGEVTVFDDVAVIRGIYDVKGAKHPNGSDIPEKPSGKWYFYVLAEDRFFSSELDPTWIVQYATSKEALISGSGKVLQLTLTEHQHHKPEVLIDLPAGFSVSALCPL